MIKGTFMEAIKKNVIEFLKEYAADEPNTLFLFDEEGGRVSACRPGSGPTG